LDALASARSFFIEPHKRARAKSGKRGLEALAYLEMGLYGILVLKCVY